MDKQQFIEALMRYFGLITEALRSDQSFEALRSRIETALNAWPGRPSSDEMNILHMFSGRVVAYGWKDRKGRAWEIPYTLNGDEISFGDPIEVKRIQLYEPVTESAPENRQRITESISQSLTVLAESQGGGRRVRAIGVTADVVNGNGRRYPRRVLADAISRLNTRLNESAGQGRLILTGEAEHPSDKGSKPNILETVVKWEAASLDAAGMVLLEGEILPTSKGKDIAVLIDNKIPIDVSQRGYGTSTLVQEGGQSVQDVNYLELTGYDLVSDGSDLNARLIESQQDNIEGEIPMTLEELLKLLKDKPEMLESVMARLGLEDKSALAESLGVDIKDLKRTLEEGAAAREELEKRKREAQIEEAITVATADLKYGELNETFVKAVRSAKPDSVEDVTALVEAKIAEYDAMMAKAKLSGMGFKVDVKGPVFEAETGQPEFTKASYLFTERLAERGLGTLRNFSEAKTKSELFARRYLMAFDEQYRRELMAESKLLEEAEAVSDLNLPYSVSRAIVAEAVPELVSASVFDFDMADTSPTRVYFEAYAAESGATATVTDETYTASHDAWVALAYARVSPGTVTVELGGTSTAKTEYTDYVVDYANGKIMVLSTGTISDSADLDVTYTYNAVRNGENAAIQRGKGTLSYQTIELDADRIAQQISDEAVTFARTQLGWDATTRTLSMLIREIREMIDQGVMRLAVAQAHIAANTGGTWTAGSDSYQDLVAKIGVAKVAIQTDNYDPTSILMSLSNADKLSNWDGFTAAGMRADAMMTPGLLGSGDTGLRIKGLPVFASKHMPDAKILVQHRELVQHRVLRTKPMTMKGPFPSYSSSNLVAAEQYFVEEYNTTVSLIAAKGAYVTVA